MAGQFANFFLNMDPEVRALKTSVKQLQDTFCTLADAEGKVRLSALPGFLTYAQTVDPEAEDRLVSFNDISNIIQNFYTREVFPMHQRLTDGKGDLNVRSLHASTLDPRLGSNGILLIGTDPMTGEVRLGSGKGTKIQIGWGDDVVTTASKNSSTTHVKGNDAVEGNLGVGKDATIDGDTLLRGDLHVLKSQVIEHSQTVQGSSEVRGDSTVGGKQSVAGPLEVQRDACVRGNMQVAGSSTVGGTQTTKGDTDLQAKLTVARATLLKENLQVDGSCYVIGDLDCDGAMSASSASVSGDSKVEGVARLTGGLEVDQNAKFRCPVQMSEALTVAKSVKALSVNVSTTKPSVADGSCAADAMYADSVDATSTTGKLSLATATASLAIGGPATKQVDMQAQDSLALHSGTLHTDKKTPLASGSGSLQMSAQQVSLHAKLLSLSAVAVSADGTVDPSAAINVTAPNINFVGKVTFSGETQKVLSTETVVADKNTTMNAGGASGSVSQASDIGSTIGGGHRWTETDANDVSTVVAWSGVAVGGGAWEVMAPGMTKPAQMNQGMRTDDDVKHRSLELTVPLGIASGGTGMSADLQGNRSLLSSADGAFLVEGDALADGQLLFGRTGKAPVAASITSTNANLAVVPVDAGGVELQLSANPSFASVSIDTALPINSGGTNSNEALVGGCPMVSKDGKIVEGAALLAGEVLMGARDGSAPGRGSITGGSNVNVTVTDAGLEVAIIDKPTFQTCTLLEPPSVRSLKNQRILISKGGKMVEAAHLKQGNFLTGVTGGVPQPCKLQSVDASDMSVEFALLDGANSLNLAMLNKIVGVYSDTTQFKVGNIACCDGGLYRCVSDCIGDKPSVSTTGCWSTLIEASKELRTSIALLKERTLSSLDIIGAPVIDVSNTTSSRYTATGHNLAGESIDMTDRVMWVSEDNSIATFAFDGTLRVISPGTVRIAAYAQGLRAMFTVTIADRFIRSIAVQPVGLIPGASQIVQATVTFSDETQQVINNSEVDWESPTNPFVATIATNGEVTARGQSGTARIPGAYAGVAFHVDVTVYALTSLRTSIQNTVNMTAGESLQEPVTVLATYANDAEVPVATGNVTWDVTNRDVAEVLPSGIIHAKQAGETNIIATVNGVVSAPIALIVAPAITSLRLEPSSLSLEVNEETSVQVYAVYSDGSEVFLTEDLLNWNSAPEVTYNTVSGMIKALAPGSATLKISYDGVEGQLPVTVRTPVVMEITVSFSEMQLDAGDSLPLEVRVSWSDGSEVIVVPGEDTVLQVESSHPDIVTVDGGWVVTTNMNGYAVGESVVAQLKFTYQSCAAWPTVTVTKPPLIASL